MKFATLAFLTTLLSISVAQAEETAVVSCWYKITGYMSAARYKGTDSVTVTKIKTESTPEACLAQAIQALKTQTTTRSRRSPPFGYKEVTIKGKELDIEIGYPDNTTFPVQALNAKVKNEGLTITEPFKFDDDHYEALIERP